MTDQIEALLEEQREREREETLELRLEAAAGGLWRSAAASQNRLPARTADGEPAGAETVDAETAEPQDDRLNAAEERPGVDAGAGLWEALAAAAHIERAGRFEPPEDGGGNLTYQELPEPERSLAAAWADRAVRNSLRPLSAASRGPEALAGTAAGQSGQTGASELEVERLDRAFQRDARRYDGGFQLR